MTFSGEDLEEEAHPRKEASSLRGRKAPELSLEWRDVTIQIRYCAGPDDEEQEFVELFPKVKILMPPNSVNFLGKSHPLRPYYQFFLHFHHNSHLEFPRC